MKWYYLYNSAEIDNKLFAVKIDIRKTPQGDRFYVHRVNLIEEKGAINQIPSNGSATIKINKTPSSSNSISQNNQSVKNNTNSKDDGVRAMKRNNSRSNTNATQTNTAVDNQGRKLSRQQQEYFKDSKVRDENGNLLVMYHGTEANVGIPENNWFTVFDIDRAGNHGSMLGDGFYFTSDRSHAEQYAHTKGNIYETYLNIKKPLELNHFSTGDLTYAIRNINPYIEADIYKRDGTLDGYKVRRYLLDNGYDGIHSGNTYVAFNSNQIKNITNTTPTEKQDIRYMRNTPKNKNTENNTSNTDNQGRTLTKRQQEYFKNSKVRDENGNLLTLYHGSSNQFTIFDQNRAGKSTQDASIGFWFTETKEGADKFNKGAWYGNDNSNVYEVYLDIKNPKIYKSIDNSVELEQIDKKLKENNERIRDIENKNFAIEVNSSDIRWASDESELQDIARNYGLPDNQINEFVTQSKEYQNLLKEQYNLEKEYENKRYNDA